MSLQANGKDAFEDIPVFGVCRPASHDSSLYHFVLILFLEAVVLSQVHVAMDISYQHIVLLSGVNAGEVKYPTGGKCVKLFCAPHSSLEKGNSLNQSGVSPKWPVWSIHLYYYRRRVCVCVCVCKIGPISARTLSFRHQTSRKFFSHSNFPIPYLWTAFCVPLSFVFYEKQ